jgi:hypothetical protein
VDGLPKYDHAPMPTNRWAFAGQSLDGVDFATESANAFSSIAINSAVAFDIGVAQPGHFVDLRTGLPIPEVVEIYSRMKHGDMDAVSFFAGHVAATAMRSERFLSLMRDGVANERVVYITTAAVFTVPSASNLLLRTTAAHLNIMLTRQGLPPVVVVELTRLSDSALGYATRTVREQRDELSAGRGVTIVPESFRGQSVVFLDDLFSTGYTTSRAERRLQKVNVADRFFLFAARIDPQAVGASQGQIEDRLNEAFIDGSLASLAPMLHRGNFTVVQKLVKVILDPKHTDHFAEFLRGVPTTSLLNLYAAAACDGFRRRSQGRYLPSILILEAALQDRGALDEGGHIMGAPVDLVGSLG